jgi:hypothetical protein
MLVAPEIPAGNQDADRTKPAAPPIPLPLLGPAAAGQVSSVQVHLVDVACSAGPACLLHVEVWVQPSARSRQVAWTVKSIPPCQGPIVDLGAGSFTAQPGWTHVASESSVTLPQIGSRALVVVSTLPDVAASTPLLLAGAVSHC